MSLFQAFRVDVILQVTYLLGHRFDSLSEGEIIQFSGVSKSGCSLDRIIPGLPAVLIETQLAQALRRLNVCLQVFVTVCTSITSLARLPHQIR